MAETVLVTAASRGIATRLTQDGYALVTPERAAARNGRSPPPAGC